MREGVVELVADRVDCVGAPHAQRDRARCPSIYSVRLVNVDFRPA